jgi:putative cell wall-binding protein
VTRRPAIALAAALSAAGVVLASMTPFAAAAATPAPAAAAAVAAAKPAVSQVLPTRIAGVNRYDTAAKLAVQFGSASTVVIANGTTDKQGFDALSANYLAGIVKAPILLTGAANLPAETVSAVKTVMGGSTDTAFQVLVMGKSDSVSDAVVSQLNAIVQPIAKDTQNHVVRVAGSSRYDTAVLAATVAGDDPTGFWVERYTSGSGSSRGKTAILASGMSNADALAAGPISNAMRIPVYLTGTAALPQSVATALSSQGISNLIVLGGTDRVPDAVVEQAKAAGVQTAVRIAGSNRFATAAALYTFARSTLSGVDGAHYGAASAPVFLANGLTGFPDALAVGPLAASRGAVLLTTSADRLEASAKDFLAAGGTSGVTALGGSATVADSVLAAAQAAQG